MKHFQLNTILNTIQLYLAHGFFNVLTAEMVNDLNDTHRKKPKLTLSTSKSLDNFFDNLDHFSNNQTNSTNNPNGITSPPLFYSKRPNELRMTR